MIFLRIFAVMFVILIILVLITGINGINERSDVIESFCISEGWESSCREGINNYYCCNTSNGFFELSNPIRYEFIKGDLE